MKKKAATRTKKQESSVEDVPAVMRRLVLPMIAGMEVTKTGLLAFVHAMGRAALDELLVSDAERVAGPKHARDPNRRGHHWGTTSTPLPFGGRDIVVERPKLVRVSVTLQKGRERRCA
jgi:hypothetical protein